MYERGNVADVRLEQPENTLTPMVVTLLGIVIDDSLEHPSNAESQMLDSPVAITAFSMVAKAAGKSVDNRNLPGMETLLMERQ